MRRIFLPAACGLLVAAAVVAVTVVAVTVVVAPRTLQAQTPAATPATPPVVAPEVLRGRVTTDSGAPIAGAAVTATMAPDREVFRAESDSAGRWRIDVPNGTGDYLVHVAAVGRLASRKRVTHTAAEHEFVIDVSLKSAVQQLAAVRVQAAKPKPTRREGGASFGAGTGEAEHDVEGVFGALTPELQGDIAAMAATTPGLLAGPNGLSALGVVGQNAVTLGGLAFSGSDLPRDLRTTTRVMSSTYDPALGWFAGARVAIDIASGGIFSARRSHLTLDAPALQATDAVGARLGQRTTNLQGSVGGDGPLHGDRLGYAWAAQAAHRTQEAPSLLDAAPDALRAAGVSPDSVARLVGLLLRAGIPGTVADVGPRRSDVVSLVGKLGRQSYDYSAFKDVRRVWSATAYGKWNRTGALGIGPTATPARGGSTRGGNAGLQAVYSGYVGKKDWLLELRSGLSGTDDRRTPYLALPGAVVQVGSPAAGAAATSYAPALTALAFGGNGALDTRRRTATWENQGELRFYPPRKTRHRVSLATDVRFDALHDAAAGDPLGTFSYPSLDALAAGRPASFSRTLAAPAAHAGVWNGFLALGDYWRRSDRLQLMYGVRLEGNAYATRPAANPALAGALGVRTDVVPNTVHASPRLGLTWLRRPGGSGFRISSIGQTGLTSGSVVRAGLGEFRSLLGPELVAPAVAATGLPGATRRLLCVGSAVPTAAWTAWATGDLASVPTTCAGGAGALAESAPSVRAVAPDYTAPRSWRGNVSYSSSRHNTQYQIEAIGSLNLHQPGVVDANFAGAPRFTLGAEGGRPVFVSAAAIDAASGALTTVEARRSASYGRVAVQRADLRSLSRQVSLTVTPGFEHFGRWFVSGTYTLGGVRQQARGFDGATFGDPRERTWARGDLDVRHQLLAQAGYARNGFSVTAFGRLASGLPFTPIVDGDVNGDGFANDRAFVFDPSLPLGASPAGATTDASVAQGLRALRAGASANVRRCLDRAVGRVAGRNACEGPWTTSLTMRVNATGTRLHLGRRANVALSLANPLGGLDQLLHGDDLRGWGTAAFPDPALYRVRGFDPSSSSGPRFRYEVNPRFGDTRPTATSLRAPFRATLDVAIDIGRPTAQQQLDKFLRPGRAGRPGTRLSVADLQKRYRCNVPDPYAGILSEGDSLLLNRPQVEALQAAQRDLRARTDSVWLDLATYLAGLDDRYDGAAALKRQETTTDSAWVLAQRHVVAHVPGILTPVQRRLAPWPAQGMLVATRPMTGMRMFMAGACNR